MQSEQRKNMYYPICVLVLGYQLNSDGTPTDDFKRSIELVTRLLEAGQVDQVIISGGRTRPEYPSEAVVGLGLIPAKFWSKVWLEEQAMSTRQNVEFCREKFLANDVKLGLLYVICAPFHEERAHLLINRFWPEIMPKVRFRTNGVKSGYLKLVANKLIYWMTLIDPGEKVFLPIKRRWLS